MTRPDDPDCALPYLYEALRQNSGGDAADWLVAALWDDIEDDDTEESR